jgi:hypothetical protein
MTDLKPLQDYMHTIEKELAAGNATEHTHRPALKTLVEGLAKGIIATNEPQRTECGAPDFLVTKGALQVMEAFGRLSARIIKDMEMKEKFNFSDFSSWHQVCHSLQGRKNRLNLSLNLAMYGCVAGAVLATVIVLTTICFHLETSEVLSLWLGRIMGLCLVASVVGIMHPCFFIWNDRRSHQGSDTSLKVE